MIKTGPFLGVFSLFREKMSEGRACKDRRSDNELDGIVDAAQEGLCRAQLFATGQKSCWEGTRARAQTYCCGVGNSDVI